jgi:AcrR family transcriptional regulator
MRTTGSQNRATPERRRAILDAALAIFLERGFERATLDAICAKVGVTKGSLYHHFSSKEQIAVTLYGEAVGTIQAELAAAIAGATTARDTVERLVTSYLGWFQRQPALGAFVFQIMDGHALDEHAEPVRVQRRAFIDALAARLDPFVARGEVVEASPRLRIAMVIGPARDFLRGWLVAPEPKPMREALRVLPPSAFQAIAAPKRR